VRPLADAAAAQRVVGVIREVVSVRCARRAAASAPARRASLVCARPGACRVNRDATTPLRREAPAGTREHLQWLFETERRDRVALLQRYQNAAGRLWDARGETASSEQRPGLRACVRAHTRACPCPGRG